MSVNKVNQTTGALSPIAGGTLYADAPVGSIQAYGGTTAPWGWLLCQGQAVSRATYAELFGVIGTSFGEGDGSSTFNVPDLRETVPVGSGTRENGVSAHDTYTVGQFKDDQLQSHTHSITSNVSARGLDNRAPTPNAAGWTFFWGGDNTNDNTGRTGTTTHGKQLGVNYIIKATTIALPSDFEAAVDDKIAALDVASVGGSGKYISAISEADGKISATATNLSTAPTSGSAVPITSGGVYSNLKDFVKVVTATGELTLEANSQDNLTLTFTTPTGYTPIVATPRSAGSWAWGIIQISPVSIANQNVAVVVKSWLPTSGTYTITANVICIRTM